MEASQLERDIFDWIADRHPELKAPLANPAVVRRDRTAAFYTYLIDDVESCDSHIEGPEIKSPLIDAGGGSILWLNEGKPVCLEVYSYSDNFTEELSEYELVESTRTA
jgi:hypothetical protein